MRIQKGGENPNEKTKKGPKEDSFKKKTPAEEVLSSKTILKKNGKKGYLASRGPCWGKKGVGGPLEGGYSNRKHGSQKRLGEWGGSQNRKGPNSEFVLSNSS